MEVRSAWSKAERQGQQMDCLEVLSKKVFVFNVEIPEADQTHEASPSQTKQNPLRVTFRRAQLQPRLRQTNCLEEG